MNSLAYLLLFLGGFFLCDVSGKEFAVVFMQNFHVDHSSPSLQVTLSALTNASRVNVSIPDGTFAEAVALMPKSPKKITLPADSELQGGVRSTKVVVIRSAGDISVVATNSRLHTRSTWLVYPVVDWGRKYCIFTPNGGPSGTFAQVAVINGPKTNMITLTLSVLAYFEDNTFYPGVPVDLPLNPWETVQLQSSQSLSGSFIVSQEPVGVFAGHSCAQKDTRCNHVCMQLLPVSSWGFNFVVPRIHFQNTTNSIYILPSAKTFVQLKMGDQRVNKTLLHGIVEEFLVDSSTPVSISSVEALMVLLYGSGGVYKSLPYDAFLLDLVPEERYCSRYNLVSMPGYKNFAFLVAHKNSVPDLKFNGTSVPDHKWGHFSGTDVTYAQVDFVQRGGYVAVQSNHPFGVFIVGVAMMKAYAVSAVCLDKGKSLPSGSTYAVAGHPNDVSDKPSLHNTCMAWGRTNYHTFHGTFVSRTVNCIALLVALAEYGADYPSLIVERKSDPDLTLRIRAFGQMLEMPTIKTTTVMVDGAQLYLPVTLQDGRINITQQGLLTKVRFSSGLNVRIGPHGFLHLQIPSNSRKLAGICAGYESHKLGNSTEGDGRYGPRWHMSDDGACDFSVQPQYDRCGDMPDVEKLCRFLEESDMFKACHMLVDPKPFVRNCRLEMCEHGTSSRCMALEAYALACGIKGVNVTGWRNMAQCAHQCPPDSHYESCLPCVGSEGSRCEGKMCYEACVCQDGYHLEMGACTTHNQSGCTWHGSYYPHGMEFLSSDCLTWCRCVGPEGKVECQSVQGCGVGYTCGLNRGWWSCNAIKRVTCSVYGGSHYVSFDGNAYNTEGPCRSKMAGLCAPVTGLVSFDIHIVNSQREGRASVYTKAIDISVYGRNLTLGKEYNGRVEVEGILFHTPLVLNDGRVRLLKSGVDGVVLQSDFGLVVLFEADGRLSVSIPVSYVDAVCGLCTAIPQTYSDQESCGNICHGANCSRCSAEEYQLYGSPENCGMLKDSKGPFRECHKLVPYESYFEGCLHDVCLHQASEESLCRVLASYTSACQEVGAVVHPWRNDTFCNVKCPPNSHYALCAPGCPIHCTGFELPSCTWRCWESCSCDPGYVLSGEECVPPEECGCMHNGHYLKPGDILYSEDCYERCECHSGNLTCKSQSCHPGEKCMVNQGVRSCFVEKLPTCWVLGNLMYYTFDGAILDASGTCAHTMGTLCEPGNLTDFTVVLWPLDGGDYMESLGKVALNLYGRTITISQDPEGVQVDEMDQNLPVALEDGKVMLSKSNSTIHVTTDFGLVFLYNPVWISLQLPTSYEGKVCGLCGNANQTGANVTGLSNDLMFPSTAYTNKGACADLGHVTTERLSYPSVYEDNKYCGGLLMKEGEFRACHDVVSPVDYFDKCVLLMEMGNGSMESLLQSFRSYSDVCQKAGAIVHAWHYILLEPLNNTDEGLKCVIDPSDPKCISQSFVNCVVFGNFTYIQFNGDYIDGSGSPKSPLVQNCELDGYPTPDFSVDYETGKNESIQQVLVRVYGMNLVMERGESAGVLVNGNLSDLPLILIPDKLWLMRNGFQLTLGTDIGLSIAYDVLDGSLVISLPESYARRACGLCQAPIYHDSADQLALINRDSLTCTGLEQDHPCSMLLNKDGPFSYCHGVVSPYGFYKYCIDQQCQDGGDNASVCEILQVYVFACHTKGAYIAPWRTDNFCPFECPMGQNYTICVTSCREYCSNTQCFPHCMEGCGCPQDLLWDGENCVNCSSCFHGKGSPEAALNYMPTYPHCGNGLNQDGSQQNCLWCMINANNITTPGNNSSISVDGAYELLKTCDPVFEHWLRIVVVISQHSLTKLHVFFDQTFITVGSSMTVWVNGQQVQFPFRGSPELSIDYSDSASVTLELMGKLEVVFSQLGEVYSVMSYDLSSSLCGACTELNTYRSLDKWLAEDLSSNDLWQMDVPFTE